MSNLTESPLDLLSRAAVASSDRGICKESGEGPAAVHHQDSSSDGDSPLDFSMKPNAPPPSTPTQTDNRPSVIRKLDPSKTPIKKRFKESLVEERVINAAPSTEIDEHFKRSLGLDKYRDIFSSGQPAASNTTVEGDQKRDSKTVEEPSPDNGSGGMSVDDHFAKALGHSKWRELQREKREEDQKT